MPKRVDAKKRTQIFAFRVNAEEQRLIAVLAEKLQRTQSDAIRLIVRETVKGLIKAEDNNA